MIDGLAGGIDGLASVFIPRTVKVNMGVPTCSPLAPFIGRVCSDLAGGRTLDRGGWSFPALVMMAGWLRHRGSAAYSAAYGRSPHVAFLKRRSCRRIDHSHPGFDL